MAHSKYKFEQFDTLHDLVETLEKRENNEVMKNKSSSKKVGEEDWNGTRTYEEAVDIMRNGYPEAVEKMKRQEKRITKVHGKQERNKQVNNIIGHTPIVPNLLLGIPTNMINTQRKVQKAKTISIIWSMVENCGVSRQEIEDNSIVVLEAINLLEQNGIRVKLDSCFFCAKNGSSEYTGASVTVKGYREKLDMTRVSGLMAHVSVFRRLGFRWLETSPTLTEDGWQYGYGQSISHVEDDYIKWVSDGFFKDGVFINMDVVRGCNRQASELVEYIMKRLDKKVAER